MKKVSNDFYEDEYEKYPSIFATPVSGTQYTINISQVFGNSYTFDEVLHILNIAQEEDIITIIINSDGGNYYSLVALKNALLGTKARIEMNLLGMAASAGSALFLCRAHNYSIGKDACMMIHNMISGAGYDDTIKTVNRATFNQKINERFIKETYKHFLTDEEIHDVIFNGKEIWLQDTEIKERLQQYVDITINNVGDSELDTIKEDLKQLSDTELFDVKKACEEDYQDILDEISSRGL